MNDHELDEIAGLRLDAIVRARHADAVSQLSPSLQAQLAQRRGLALRGSAPRRTHGLRNAALAFAALGALALGLRLQFTPAPSPALAAPTAVAAVTTPAAPVANVTLDQDPDFYIWLGGSEPERLAME